MNNIRKKHSVKNLIAEGIKILRGGDEDIDRLIAPRSEEIISLLERYVKEIELFNPAYGLVAVNDTNELIIKHILDSIAPVGIISRLLKEQKKDGRRRRSVSDSIADAGSGAGLPGIPLAIILNNCDLTLIEKMKRRAGFLLNTQAVLSLNNIAVIDCELEKAAYNLEAIEPSGIFNLIIFRAFKPFDPKLLKSLKKLCKPDGVIAAYKGRREKIETEITACEKTLTQKLQWEALPCPVPYLDEERHILVIR